MRLIDIISITFYHIFSKPIIQKPKKNLAEKRFFMRPNQIQIWPLFDKWVLLC